MGGGGVGGGRGRERVGGGGGRGRDWLIKLCFSTNSKDVSTKTYSHICHCYSTTNNQDIHSEILCQTYIYRVKNSIKRESDRQTDQDRDQDRQADRPTEATRETERDHHNNLGIAIVCCCCDWQQKCFNFQHVVQWLVWSVSVYKLISLFKESFWGLFVGSKGQCGH